MLDEDEALIERLREDDEEFRRLLEEHISYEGVLESFNEMRYLTMEQEVERKRIQKLKLKGKDRMAEIIRRYKSTNTIQG